MRVAIGPRHELHVGIHGSLLTSPPAGIEYILPPYDVRFLHRMSPRSRAFSPAHDYALAEWLRFGEDAADFDVVHSARLPVEGKTSWIVDADSLLATLKIGSFFALASHERFVDGEIEQRDVRLRAAMMLSRYCSTDCSAVLLLTEHARAELLGYAAASGLLRKAATEALARKCWVVHAAVTMPPAVEDASRIVPSILYMGRTFEDKGGVIAAAALLRLREIAETPFEASFVGPCPEPLAARLRAAGIRVHPILARDHYLRLLAGSDIFLSPTSFESYGMAIHEAATSGMAIVCSSGPGMEAVELVTDRWNALLVSNALAVRDRVAATVEALSALLRDSDLRRGLAANNRALTSDGDYSITRRNAILQAVYDEAGRKDADDESIATLPPGEFQITDWSAQLCEWELTRRAPEPVRIRL